MEKFIISKNCYVLRIPRFLWNTQYVFHLMKTFLSLISLFFLIGCDLGVRPQTSSPVDSVPTIVALTAAALPSPTLEQVIPTSTPSPPDTPTPLPTATFLLTAMPKSQRPAIQVLSPGIMSKVVSPIILKSYIQPGANGLIQIELLGEDGRLLARDLFRRETIHAEGAYINIEIPFETRSAAEVGRMQISTKDEFNRPLEIESIHLLLLSVGENNINLGSSPYARSVFFYPTSKTKIYGGVLPIIGEMQSHNNNPIVLDLLDEEGHILATRVLSLAAGERTGFETTLEYKIDEEVEARLIIHQADEKFVGNVYLLTFAY